MTATTIDSTVSRCPLFAESAEVVESGPLALAALLVGPESALFFLMAGNIPENSSGGNLNSADPQDFAQQLLSRHAAARIVAAVARPRHIVAHDEEQVRR